MADLGPFGHVAEPRAVANKLGRPRYRDDGPANLMSDPRVSRGSTYSLYRQHQGQAGDPVGLGGLGGELPNPPLRQTGLRAGPLRGPGAPPGGHQPESPPARSPPKKALTWREQSIYEFRPAEKASEALDFDMFLIEQKPAVTVAEVDTQTDLLQPLPPPQPYVPKKTGVDAATQMTPDDQPFDFDREVGPLLAVVVAKTLEQASLEVEQEEELTALAEELDRLQTAQRAEAARVRAIEVDTMRELELKQARVKAERERQAREDRVKTKVASVRLMKQVWPDVRESAFEWFELRGKWTNRRTQSIRADFLPWLFDEVDGALRADQAAVDLVDSLVASALDHQRLVEEDARGRAAEEAERLRKEEEERRRNTVIRIFVDGTSLGLEDDTQVGPIKVLPTDTVSAVEAKVKEWLAEAGIDVELPADGFLHLAFSGRELTATQMLIDEDIADNARLEVLQPSGSGDGGEDPEPDEEEG